MERQTVYTVTAHCHDCYRCVRGCPVKAISLRNGQAQVEDELCIKCGSCVRECPQGAKTIRSDLADVKAAGETFSLVASIAPSFAAVYSGKLVNRLPSALRILGFSHAAETAEGAMYITVKSFASGTTGKICTACPVVVNYIEKYKPELIDDLIPVVSPVIAHGRMLKERYPGCKVIFIGPCAAKKSEIMRPENIGAVDYAITFSELKQWLDDEGVKVEDCPETGFENMGETGCARLFPIQGGMLKTGGKPADGTEVNIMHISGAKSVLTLLGDKDALSRCTYVEPLFCDGGCISGPDFKDEASVYTRRSQIVDYYQNETPPALYEKGEVNFMCAFNGKVIGEPDISEQQINAVFEKTGKADPNDRLNCGACGYSSCIEKAKAVIRNMAEPDICMPYMRRMAKKRADRIIETDPNGVVILDANLQMTTMNPAFKKMFMCNDGILGTHISYLVNADNYEKLAKSEGDIFESVRTKYGIRYHEIVYSLRDEDQYVGIYADISKLKLDERQMEIIKFETLNHAKEFLEHQVRFSQEMAHYLGKSTAQGEEIAHRLISLYEEEGEIR